MAIDYGSQQSSHSSSSLCSTAPSKAGGIPFPQLARLRSSGRRFFPPRAPALCRRAPACCSCSRVSIDRIPPLCVRLHLACSRSTGEAGTTARRSFPRRSGIETKIFCPPGVDEGTSRHVEMVHRSGGMHECPPVRAVRLSPNVTPLQLPQTYYLLYFTISL